MTAETLSLHMSQMINAEMEMSADGDKGVIVIKTKVSKSGKYYIATGATEYWVIDDGKVFDEGENPVDLPEAMKHLTSYLPQDIDNIDNQFSAYTKEGGLKPLVWFTGEKGNRTGNTMQLTK